LKSSIHVFYRPKTSTPFTKLGRKPSGFFQEIRATALTKYFRSSNQKWPESLFSDSHSAPVSKFLNPVPAPAIFQIWESDSCSDSGYTHQSNLNLPMFLPKK